MHDDVAQLVFTDLETRSRRDLGTCDSYEYARDPSTEVLVLKYREGMGPVQTWMPGDPVPLCFFDPSRTFVAMQTTGFEILMFRWVLTPRHGFPPLDDCRWECGAAMAAYAGLPQGLGKISARLDLGDHSKDASGHLNMLRLATPVGATIEDGRFVGGYFDNDYVRHAKNRMYCEQDVIAECASFMQLPRLPQRERQVWLLHRKINDRGVPVDLQLCYGARAIIEIARHKHLAELEKITGGTITSVDQIKQIKDFAASRGVDLRLRPDADPEEDDDAKPNLREGTLSVLVPKIEDAEVKRVLEIRQLLTAAAVKKYQAVIDWAGDDWRCRGFSNYYGAGPGRWSACLGQFQNLFRPQHKPDVIAAALPFIQRGDYDAVFALSKGDVLGLLSSCVRSILCAEPGNVFAVSDFSSVEARMLAWLADEENLLEPFRRNEDLYVKMACEIFGCTPQDIYVFDEHGKVKRDEHGEKMFADGGKQKRQIGKCNFLGPGYQMGWSHLIEVARTQAKVDLSEELARAIIDTFRGNYPKVPQFWRDIENAAKYCVKTGKTVSHPKFRFRKWGDWLVMRIPSGRELFYFEPRFELNERGRDQLIYTSTRGVKQLYGGLLTENIDQAASRDLLADAMLRADALDLFTVMHCHDEVVVEHERDTGETAAQLHWCMEQVEPWAEGMPLAAETHDCERYAK